MKQTAVQWFATRVTYLNISPKEMHDFLDWYEEAKEIEKEQMGDTWVDSRTFDKGDNYFGKQKSFDEYYNETYGDDT